jgi:peptidyl-prolyl cis-trans isomerase C
MGKPAWENAAMPRSRPFSLGLFAASLIFLWEPAQGSLFSRAHAQPRAETRAKPKADADPASDEAPREIGAKVTRTPEDEARRKQIVARGEGVEVTVGELEDQIAQQSPILRARYKNPEELKKLLDNIVRFELLAAEATRHGYEKNAAVVRTVKDGMVQNLVRAEIDGKLTPQSIPAEDVKTYYDAHPEEFHREAMRSAKHILVKTEAEAKALIAEAKNLDMRAFADRARKDSLDIETKLRGGDLGYFAIKPSEGQGESKVHEALRKAAFALKESGDTTSKPIPVDGHFSVLRLTGERPAQNTTLAEAEASIRTRLWRERKQQAMTALIEGLRSKEGPKVNADLVDLIKIEDMDKGPAGFTPETKGEKKRLPTQGGE